MSNARNIASGAKFVDTAGDTMSGNLLLSSGSVGVGTTSPLRQLSALSTTGNAEVSLVSGTSNQCSILMGDGTTGTDIYKGYLQYDNNTDGMLIATNATSRINIDSSGRVTMPYQAYGEAEGNNSGLLTGFAANSNINWFTANHLNGGMSFSNNGRFTVPVGGRYLINAQIYYYPSGSHTAHYALNLKRNGTVDNFVIDDHAETVSGNVDRTVQLNMMVRASANDYFELSWGSNINGQFWRGADHNKFRILLLG
mgnify:CR=1 FL=1